MPDEAGHTDESKKEILDIFGYDAFPSPKPKRLIERILRMYTTPDSNDIILDSFAGSGTTAHAVLALNREDERSVAEYFGKIGSKVSWQKLGEDFQDQTFRFYVLDQGEYEDRDWRDDLKKLLEQV